jgi:peroxiredoxin
MSETRLQVGDRAIDAELPDLQGTPVTLSSLWQSHGVILSFLRHFG